LLKVLLSRLRDIHLGQFQTPTSSPVMLAQHLIFRDADI